MVAAEYLISQSSWALLQKWRQKPPRRNLKYILGGDHIRTTQPKQLESFSDDEGPLKLLCRKFEPTLHVFSKVDAFIE